MMRLFARSLALQIGWWCQAFGREGRRLAPLSPRRLVFLFLLYPPFVVLQLVHWLAFGLDEIFFPGYRDVAIEDPLIVTGVPRSGTTFVHRLLAAESQAFSTMRTWEVLLAPAVSERRLIQGLAAFDRFCGGLGARLLARATKALVGDRMEDVHAVGLDAAEEDYLALLPAAGCFGLVLAFPTSEHLWSLGSLSSLPRRDREALIRFYAALVQKHLYVFGKGRRFLSKNAAFGTWIPALAERFDRARFLVCVRAPLEGLSSQLSSIEPARALFGIDPGRDRLNTRFIELFERTHVALEKTLAEGRLDVAVVDAVDLREAPVATLAAALARLGVDLRGDLGVDLAADLGGEGPTEIRRGGPGVQTDDEAGPRRASVWGNASENADPSRHAHRPSDFGLTLDALPLQLIRSHARLRDQRSRPGDDPRVGVSLRQRPTGAPQSRSVDRRVGVGRGFD